MTYKKLLYNFQLSCAQDLIDRPLKCQTQHFFLVTRLSTISNYVGQIFLKTFIMFQAKHRSTTSKFVLHC